jgi:hypothetical protein
MNNGLDIGVDNGLHGRTLGRTMDCMGWFLGVDYHWDEGIVMGI